eukprot:TRINITY_DN535_c0_g1_i1.p3 TRINITY_DN535_c0_g1~~TRINITY_DN535_c0_g1_i1.p3  ORF type:complete len:371 (+),score=116.40 TRINITY_DN535_c0_g1_i1:101-1114(+)
MGAFKRVLFAAAAATAVLATVAAPAAATAPHCVTHKYKCGVDPRRCWVKKGCAKYGCDKTVTYPCYGTKTVKFDCPKPYTTTCKKEVTKDRPCTKTRTKWVPNGCTRTVKEAYKCKKDGVKPCRKTRVVHKPCKKTVYVPCKKYVAATCTRHVEKTCHKSVKRAYACDKRVVKYVPCPRPTGGHPWAASKTARVCKKVVTVKDTCYKRERVAYDCSYDHTYACKKAVHGRCAKVVGRTCPVTEHYWAKCPTVVEGRCYRNVTQRYACKKTETYHTRCPHTATESVECVKHRVVKDGCSKTVRYPKQCTKTVHVRRCCARPTHVKVCAPKYCTKRVCK